MTRTEKLRMDTINSVHKQARVAMPVAWETKTIDASLPERKAYAIKMLLDAMPLYIGKQELIVGTRTIYKSGNEAVDKSDMGLVVMPSYVNEKDIQHFNHNGEFYTQGHYTAGYEKLLQQGIIGILETTQQRIL